MKTAKDSRGEPLDSAGIFKPDIWSGAGISGLDLRVTAEIHGLTPKLELEQKGRGKGVSKGIVLTTNSWGCSARPGMDGSSGNRARRVAEFVGEELESRAMCSFPARFLR